MAIHAHRCFTVTCDVCQKPVASAYDDDITIHFDTEAEALSHAEDSDWHVSTSGGTVCDRVDEAHEKAVAAHHAEGMQSGHRCWRSSRDEDEATAQ